MTKPINDKISWEIALLKKDFHKAYKIFIALELQKQKFNNNKRNDSIRSSRISN